MNLTTYRHVLAHTLADLVLVELAIQHATSAADALVTSEPLEEILDRCHATSTTRVVRLQHLLSMLVDEPAVADSRIESLPAHPMHGIAIDSDDEAIDLVVLSNIRHLLSSAQRLYADTAVRAVRWKQMSIAEPLGEMINQITQLLSALESMDTDLTQAFVPSFAAGRPDDLL